MTHNHIGFVESFISKPQSQTNHIVQPEDEVTRQLQVNMMLFTAGLLRRKLEDPAKADSIKSWSFYGLQLGATY